MKLIKNIFNEEWYNKLEKVKNYITNYKKQPSQHDTQLDIKKLGIWLNRQKQIYKKNMNIMKKQEIRELWEEFMDEYNIDTGCIETKWNNNLIKIKLLIHKNIELNSKDKKWILTQKLHYKKNCGIMKKVQIKYSWEKFIDEYNIFINSNENKWNNNLSRIKELINQNIKLSSKDKCWIMNQKYYYKNNRGAMKNEKYRNIWKEFNKKYLNKNNELDNFNMEELDDFNMEELDDLFKKN